MKKIWILICVINSLVFAEVKFLDVKVEEAQRIAKDENKKILIDFYTDWCIPCKELDRHIFADSIISKFINENYICLKINAETDYGRMIGKELSLQEAYPTVILLTSDKKELDRLLGLIQKEEYFQRIKDYTNNINTFDELLKKEHDGNNDLELKEQIATKYFERGNLIKAIEYYQYLIDSEKFNSDGNIYFRIARSYSFLNNIAKSKEYIEKAISKDPSQEHYKKFLEKLESK